jgi:hypothetical protein
VVLATEQTAMLPSLQLNIARNMARLGQQLGTASTPAETAAVPFEVRCVQNG